MERKMKHRFHKHPLVFVEKQSDGGDKACCSACGDVVSAPCFSCALCNYHLHSKCAEAPYLISSHPLHPQHSGFFLRKIPYPNSRLVYGCALCKEKRSIFFYECEDCWFSLDIKCADLSSSYSKVNQESKHDIHPHPLTLIQSPMEEHKSLSCAFCHELLVGPLYICVDCPFIFHKRCVDGSNKLFHHSHRIHPLFLESKERPLFCKLCQKKHEGFFYSCSVCDVKMNFECARPAPIVEYKSRHPHPFTLLWRQGSFICDACATEGNYVSYICSTCNIEVHKDCTKLPRIIKFSRHDHCLFHKYFLVTQELARQDHCKICFSEVKLDRGSFSCAKPGCSYIVHVNCALEDGRFYDVLEEESQCEELYRILAKSMQSSIIRVLEVNKDGEATKIEHFSHEGHFLVLEDKNMEETDRKCDGCMLLVSTPFYYCSESECHFCLHKECAELPRKKPLWLHRSSATLNSKDVLKCDFCHRVCSGFFYEIGPDDVCLRCAKVPDIFELQGHCLHFLSYDFKCRNRCNGCGSDPGADVGAFRCRKCSFALDFACLTLPHSTLHKFDEHMLNLTYHDDNDYSKHRYCDICERKRDPSLWYYSCLICDTLAHPECVLGQLPFVKVGALSRPCYCPKGHKFLLFRKVEGYPRCSYCGMLCQEEILKCTEATCSYFLHFKCEESYVAMQQSPIDPPVRVDWEATEIQHFSHPHCLVLADKIVEETDGKCDGCMLPVSTPFYYCSESECHFCLHKECAELPRKKRHWFRPHIATLNSTRFNYCYLCSRYCSGFFYDIGGFGVCLRCFKVPDIIEFPGHCHVLFYDFKWKGRCNGCGKTQSMYGAFRCGKCHFVLDFTCLSLPRSVLHKSDQHMLNLTYYDDNDYFCDICERKRDPTLWYYSCSICDTSAHVDCALGQYPFLKDRIRFSCESIHHHDLLFFRKVAECYPECSHCSKFCQE